MALLEELGSIPRKIERASLITSGSSGGVNAGPLGAPVPGWTVSTAKADVGNEESKRPEVSRTTDIFRHENIMLPSLEGGSAID
jgi:hypothetical protein